VSVRSVCRVCGLNTRYFYESFPDTDGTPRGGVRRRQPPIGRGRRRGDGRRGRLAARQSPGRHGRGARIQLRRSARGRVLFTDARANPVLAKRRVVTRICCSMRWWPRTAGYTLMPIRSLHWSARRCTPARWPSSPSSGWRATSATTSTPSSTMPWPGSWLVGLHRVTLTVAEVHLLQASTRTSSAKRSFSALRRRSSPPTPRRPAATPARAGRGPCRPRRRSVRLG